VTKGSTKYKMVGGQRVKKEKTKEDLDTAGVMDTTQSNMSRESIESIALVDKGEYDREGDMAKEQLHTIKLAARELASILSDDENLPEWVQSKITKAMDYIDTARDYMLSQHAERAEEQPIAENANVGNIRLKLTEPQSAILLQVLIGSPESKYYKEYIRPITAQLIGQGITAGYDKRTLKQFGPSQQGVAEKAVSVAQRRAAGIAHAAQKGEIPKKELRGASKEMARMPKGELKKFAKTKETGLPEKVKEADTEPKEKKSSGGFQFGKGVYESMDKRLTQALTEGMNISVNMNTGPDGQPSKNITVSADGEDAEALAQLLKMAGLGGNAETCPACGKSDCGCQAVDENSPDLPTNKMYTNMKQSSDPISNDLNRDKSTGQTTVPVVASQLRRQVSMEESVKLESDLFRLYQNYKAQ
jgi:hypothetical protein